MNVLVIDSYDDHYHNQFNDIHIKALVATNNNVIIAGRCNHYGEHIEKIVHKVINIPSCLYCKRYTKGIRVFFSRVFDVIRLIYLNAIIKKANIDRIVFIRYDIMTIPFFVTLKKVYLINHQTANDLENSIKNIILKIMPKNYIHIALNETIKEYIISKLPNRNVITIPHGLLSSFNVSDTINYSNLYGERIIFCSATSSVDAELLQQIIESEKVSQYLVRQNINLLIKSKCTFNKKSNIYSIDGFIDKDVYQWLIKKSIAVFLPYNKSFGYRVSGVFFECVANNTAVITSNIDAFKSYKTNQQPIHCINDELDFINSIESILCQNKVWNKSEFDPIPYWVNVLKK